MVQAKVGHRIRKADDPEPVVEAKEWLPRPLYYWDADLDDWLQFDGQRRERRAALRVVLANGDVLDIEAGVWTERFDPVKMRNIQKLFEPLEPGLGEDDAPGSE